MHAIQTFLQDLQNAALPYALNEPLSVHTTFRIGGPAKVFCRPQTAEQLAQMLNICRRRGMRYYLLGNGSNVLFSDAGFDGAVISTAALAGEANQTTRPDGTALLTANAGMQLAALCKQAQKSGLAGLEFAYGIPGTVGGAIYMNAGAYGGEMKDVLTSVTFLDADGRFQTLPAEALELGYRTSVFARQPWCVVEATFRLPPGDPEAILARMQDLMQRRREKQPLDLPSAGSTFKRPAGAFAGRLIEDCGLRGFAVGGAAISTKHCGFVVNTGGATCADVLALTERVQEIVRQKTGFILEREIRVVE